MVILTSFESGEVIVFEARPGSRPYATQARMTHTKLLDGTSFLQVNADGDNDRSLSLVAYLDADQQDALETLRTGLETLTVSLDAGMFKGGIRTIDQNPDGTTTINFQVEDRLDDLQHPSVDLPVEACIKALSWDTETPGDFSTDSCDSVAFDDEGTPYRAFYYQITIPAEDSYSIEYEITGGSDVSFAMREGFGKTGAIVDTDTGLATGGQGLDGVSAGDYTLEWADSPGSTATFSVTITTGE